MEKIRWILINTYSLYPNLFLNEIVNIINILKLNNSEIFTKFSIFNTLKMNFKLNFLVETKWFDEIRKVLIY